MKSPTQCNDLSDVGAEIDRLDRTIVEALAERFDYVKAASRFKDREDSILAPDSVSAMLTERRGWAREAGLDPDIAESMFRELIAWYLDQQVLYYRATVGNGLSAGDHARLLDLLREGKERARAGARPILVSLTRPVGALNHIQAFAAAASCFDEAFLWSADAGEFSIVSLGVAHLINPTDCDRFKQTAAAWRNLMLGALIDNPRSGPGTGPLLAGGFSFDPTRERTSLWEGFDDTSMVLPRLQLNRSHGTSWLTFNIMVSAATEVERAADALEEDWRTLVVRCMERTTSRDKGDPIYMEARHAEHWKALVRDAAAAIRSEQFRKVVLAREVKLRSVSPFEIGQVLDQLSSAYPSAYLFAVRRKERCFLGATPERLVRLDGGNVQVSALAGTSRRSPLAAEDGQLGEQLLRSGKDRLEHSLVVESLRATLGRLCTDLNVPQEPVLLKLKNVQHLLTPISGTLTADCTLLDLVSALHPTPAVGGMPGAAALTYLRDHERLDRGWYAGPIGWLDADGNGEFAVALRCALVSGGAASLFAGCGIVGDSNPEHEFRESCDKLRAVLFALAPEKQRVDVKSARRPSLGELGLPCQEMS